MLNLFLDRRITSVLLSFKIHLNNFAIFLLLLLNSMIPVFVLKKRGCVVFLTMILKIMPLFYIIMSYFLLTLRRFMHSVQMQILKFYLN